MTTMSNDVKLCINCDKCVISNSDWGKYYNCHFNIDPVDGEKTYKDCGWRRENDCGKEAKFFVPKRTFWMKLLGKK